MRGQKLSKIHFLILLSLLGFISPLQSQEYKFRTLGVEDGLSQITVSDICQDEKSRIWIATLDGLNCFDGNHIKVFNHFHNDSISYGNLYVTQMVEDGQGSLFLLTSTGLWLSSYLVWVGVKFSNAKEEELLINDASQIGSKKFDFSIE